MLQLLSMLLVSLAVLKAKLIHGYYQQELYSLMLCLPLQLLTGDSFICYVSNASGGTITYEAPHLVLLFLRAEPVCTSSTRYKFGKIRNTVLLMVQIGVEVCSCLLIAGIILNKKNTIKK